MLRNEKLVPQRARPVDEPFLILRPRILASVDTGKTTMTSSKTLVAAALLSAMTLTPVFAQAAIQEPSSAMRVAGIGAGESGVVRSIRLEAAPSVEHDIPTLT